MSTSRTERPTPAWWAWFALIVLIAFVVRWRNLGTWDVWTDELHTMQIARTGEYSFGPAYKTAPLNFILTAWVMRGFGDTIVVARSVPFVAGLLTIPFLMLLAARWVGRRAALVAGLLVAISSWHVYWSQNARHFALTTLFVLVGLHGFLAFWRDEKRWGLVVAPVALLLGLFTHSSAGFYLAALLAFVGGSLLWRLVRPSEGLPSVKHHLLALGSLLIALAIYLPAYLSVGKYLLGNVAPWNPAWNILGSLAFYVTPALGCLALAGICFLLDEGDSLGPAMFSWIAVPVLLLTFASNFTTASAAYYLPSLLAFALLAGVATDRLFALLVTPWARRAGVAIIAAVVGSLSLELALYHTSYRGLKPRWADVAAYIKEQRRPDDLVLASEADVVAYYLGSHDGVAWMDIHAADLSAASVPRQAGGGTWYAVYATTGSLLTLPEAAQRHLSERATLKRVFQMHYGPKDRTLAVFYEPPSGAP